MKDYPTKRHRKFYAYFISIGCPFCSTPISIMSYSNSFTHMSEPP